MMLARFIIPIVLVAAVPARAGNVCHQDGQGVYCMTDQEFEEKLAGFDEQYPDSPLSSADFVSIVQEARERTGSDALMVDADRRFHGAVLGQALGDGRFELVQDLGVIAPPLLPVLPFPMPPIAQPDGLDGPLRTARSSYEESNEIHEDGGINTDGQHLYGRPGSAATWGCTGYESIDTCKACCMATRSVGLAPIAGWAKVCHGAVASSCTVAAWICHLGCAASEAIMLGVLWYSADKCNDNCQRSFWNDTSVDWQGVQHSSLRQALASDDYQTCEGWVSHCELGGNRWLALSEDWWNVEETYNCMMLLDPDNDVVEELYWGAVGHRVKVVGEWPYDFRPVDYRIVDIDCLEDGRQIPYVGTTGIDDEGVYITLERTGEKLYLDHRTNAIFESLKVWVWGERNGNRLQVRRWNILWWSWLEGVL